MYRTIEFAVDFTMDLEVCPLRPHEVLLVRRGTRRKARIRPPVLEAPGDVADLFFDDGSAARMVSRACFCVVE